MWTRMVSGITSMNFLESALGCDQEPSITHDLFRSRFGFQPDVKTQSNDINVCSRTPRCAGVFAIGIAEGDMDAWKFFVLQDIAYHSFHAEIGADRELSDAIRVFICVGIIPKIFFKLLVDGTATHDAVSDNLNGERSCLKQAITRAKPITYYAVHYKYAINLTGGGEALASG